MSSDPGYTVNDYAHLLGADAAEEYDEDGGMLLGVETWQWREQAVHDGHCIPAIGDGTTEQIEARRALLAFIASARTDVPALLVEVRRLRAIIARVVGYIAAAGGEALAQSNEPKE